MKARLAGLALTVGLAVLPSAAATGQVPGRDSVTANVPTTIQPGTIFSLYSNIEINAESGPSGENATGTASVSLATAPLIDGEVTCLTVSGNTAVLNVVEPPNTSVFTIEVVDNEATGTPDTFDTWPLTRSPSDCSPLPEGVGLLSWVTSGDISIFDAPPLPTSKDQCKDGGWRNFPSFKNQGNCVSFVATGADGRSANADHF